MVLRKRYRDPAAAVKVATWNINSIRARNDRLLAWLRRTTPDVVCLQETKVVDEAFPRDEVGRAGYEAAVHGQKSYNGVAILTRKKLTSVRRGLGDDPHADEARLIAGSLDGLRIISVYLPLGGAVGTDKWVDKLEWYARLKAYMARNFDPTHPLLLCGDFNVAPEERDVARPDEWRNSVLCHEEGRAALRDLMSWGLIDTVRLHHDGPGPYSWWDYRMLAFRKGNGLRLDHILATRLMADRCREAFVDREARKGTKPSDHAPVLAVFG